MDRNLNRSLSENIVIQKNKPFGFYVIEPGTNINIKYEMTVAKNRTKTTLIRKKYQKGRTQSGGFLNRYDFAYVGRDVVNQLGKVTPGVIKSASSEINNVAQRMLSRE